ncbi:MAG: 1-deoxy-D-xylulose-5-phosphate synthase [Streptococcaceae bacterium]|jgi:1-deoxy-D-xylulose-5-phosphate synthase|nr:1-deoxy-D-xylulose-5-phosphate synthase [Streptococcaceae bacterium]
MTTATKFELLHKINSPQDVKQLTIEEMKELATQARELIINKVNAIGGHMGPNLGFVEATIALHYVFNSPKDKFVFDVSHQCYTHKMLTGRKEGYLNPEKYQTISGFTNPHESEHDIFEIGHTSTSVSLATGLAKGRDLTGGNENIIAIIGDGSLSGGQAFEGLSNAAELNSNMIILVNDNDMSISPNAGGLYQNLALLRETKGTAKNNFFTTLGFDYLFVEDGNDVEALIEVFNQVKDSNKPVILHVLTEKGLGLPQAQTNKEAFHWILPEKLRNAPTSEDYNSITVDYILEKAKNDQKVVAITPGTAGLGSMRPEVRAKLGSQFIDVGIAEQHAVALASGIATNGGKPILQISSSFVQRAYDQLSQDLALNNAPATILVYRSGISSADATHLGTFDIPLISNIPNITYLMPTNKEEYLAMLDWSVEQTEQSVVIRVPNTQVTSTGNHVTFNGDLSYKVIEKGSKIAILALGQYFEKGREIAKELGATLINPVSATHLDTKMLEELKQTHDIIVTLEDGQIEGGFGEKIANYYSSSTMKVLTKGATKRFSSRESMDDLFARYGLENEQIVKDVLQLNN